jgi:hypothetical protein
MAPYMADLETLSPTKRNACLYPSPASWAFMSFLDSYLTSLAQLSVPRTYNPLFILRQLQASGRRMHMRKCSSLYSTSWLCSDDCKASRPLFTMTQANKFSASEAWDPLVLRTRMLKTPFNGVFIKMRHFSDFETCGHILQVQFFPPKIQFWLFFWWV